MLLKVAAYGLLALLTRTSLSLPTQDTTVKKTTLLHQFPNGTWVENIAVRSNNQLLVGTLPSPDLYALDPFTPNPQPKLIHTFSNVTAVFGIAEYAPDVFAVAVGNYTFQGLTEGSFAIYKVDFTRAGRPDSKPSVSLIARVPQIGFVNGVCVFPSRPATVLLGDITGGQVFRFNTQTGVATLVVPPTNPLVKAENTSEFGEVGVDGLRVRGDYLYAANVGTGVFGKIAINPDGTPQAGAEPIVIARAADGTTWDDFVLDKEGNAYAVTGSGNTVVKITPDGRLTTLGGNKNSTEIAEPTSVALSRGLIKEKKLFVVTGGGANAPINGDEIVGGQVLVIDL